MQANVSGVIMDKMPLNRAGGRTLEDGGGANGGPAVQAGGEAPRYSSEPADLGGDGRIHESIKSRKMCSLGSSCKRKRK